MAEDYPARLGDCISSIAYEHGFFWETLWNHPQNAELKSDRKEPNVLKEGDIVYIPDLTLKEESGASEKRHRFKLKGVPAKLRLRIMEEPKPPPPPPAGSGPPAGRTTTSVFEEPAPADTTRKDEPRAHVPYILNIDGELTRGETDGDGRVELSIPPNAQHGVLILDEGKVTMRVIPLNLGHLDPMSESAGVAQRLANLGFPCGDGADPDALLFAIRAFQEKNGLRVTGEADDETRSKLHELHGS